MNINRTFQDQAQMTTDENRTKGATSITNPRQNIDFFSRLLASKYKSTNEAVNLNSDPNGENPYYNTMTLSSKVQKSDLADFIATSEQNLVLEKQYQVRMACT